MQHNRYTYTIHIYLYPVVDFFSKNNEQKGYGNRVQCFGTRNEKTFFLENFFYFSTQSLQEQYTFSSIPPTSQHPSYMEKKIYHSKLSSSY